VEQIQAAAPVIGSNNCSLKLAVDIAALETLNEHMGFAQPSRVGLVDRVEHCLGYRHLVSLVDMAAKE